MAVRMIEAGVFLAVGFGVALLIGRAPGPRSTESVPWCMKADPAQPEMLLTPREIADLNGTGAAAGKPLPRRKLSELSTQEWRDFTEALAIFRFSDSDPRDPRAPDSGYLALAARHGNPDAVRERLLNSPLPQTAPCRCNHATPLDITNNPADPSQPLFLLWHRAYIHAFELSLRFIMRDELAPIRAKLNLPPPDWKNFRLPYWDWSSGKAIIQEAERARICDYYLPQDWPSLVSKDSIFPNGPPDLYSIVRIPFKNPFYDSLRSPKIFGWTPIAKTCSVPLFALAQIENPMVGTSPESFTAFNKRFFDSWHQVIHEKVGNSGGQTMGSTDYASQDPLFWVHHSNVDRLWMAWVAKRKKLGDSVPVPDLVAAWEKQPVVFPVRVNGVARVYRPEYASLAVNSYETALDYRYSDDDFYSRGPDTRRDIAEIKQRIALTRCRDHDEVPSCLRPSAWRSELIGRAKGVEVKRSGALLTLDISNAQRKELVSALRSTEVPAGSLYQSVYVALQLSVEDILTFRESAHDSLLAVQLYLVLQPSKKEGGAPLVSEITANHYLGTLDLFDPERASQLDPERRWQYFGIAQSAAANTLRTFLAGPAGEDWHPIIAIVPIFKTNDAVEQPDERLIRIDKISIAGRGPSIVCPLEESICPLAAP